MQGLEKAVRRGTHRVLPPEETWRRIRPHLHAAGITRVADITRLDDIGIPVWQAIRPMSRNLSVSQGKGITPLLARISATMESLELWHAEELLCESVTMPVGVASRTLPYPVEALPLHDHNVLSDSTVVEWIPARGIVGGVETVVPRHVVELDYTLRPAWTPPLFKRTSNGLASGNTLDEAMLHGLLELVERDALADAHLRTRIDMASIDGPDSAWLLDICTRAGVEIEAMAHRARVPMPTFEVVIRSESYPYPCRGAGSHPDREVAFCRALTEAAQSRLTVIAGARDDLHAVEYADVANRWTLAPSVRRAAALPLSSYSEVASVDDPADLHADLEALTRAVEAVTGLPVLRVDLTRDGIGVPVTRVIAPGMRMPEGM
jgi:ribosomal protein S12 methylthiotransferase accessory factor